APAGFRVADLHEELAVMRELENLTVLAGRVAAKPDVPFVVDEDAVLVGRPLVSLAGPAPRLHDAAVLIEFDHRRSRNAALGGRRLDREADLIGGKGPRGRDAPPVVLRVDEHGAK